ncbi:MAG: anaerobic carbon-monoxide dehydrogenase catalytic subunit [Clostridiales bacterium]|nr:anaerobic carbon-monoxide dehydrogenase catalytic subunit [Clostridiales bacterium]
MIKERVKYHHKLIGEDHVHHHEEDKFDDYTQAVNEYRKTFASKQDVIEKTPDPAVKELILHMEDLGIDNTFDRFDKQKPQCSFGLAGVCCRICNMGPCKITKKATRGVCGADADLIVARNMLRAIAAGSAQHGAHARDVILSLKFVSEGKLNLPILGEKKILEVSKTFGIETEGKDIKYLAGKVADILLEDLSRAYPGEYKTLKAMAPEERQKVWGDMDIIPISAYHETFEANHRSGCATDGDWKNVMQQFLRCGLAFLYTGVVGSAIATDSLFGIGDRATTKVNVGALKKGYVNIAVHGHLPTLVSEIVRIGSSEEFINLAKSKGAKGIQFYGICCSGLSSMYRYHNVIPLANAFGAEFVLATGALDLWVADVQDVFPSIMDVAKCFKTVVVTTSDSARLRGAEHYAYDHRHSNVADTEKIARKIVTRAIESFEERKGMAEFIPNHEITGEVGFSVEYIKQRFGSFKPIADALKSGQILGIVNLVGCNNPRVIYERAIVDVCQHLIENNILVLTNGCASFPLLKLGYCRVEAKEKAGESLRAFLGDDLPPVWHMGECIDNTRASGTFAGIAAELNTKIKDMPYALASPEWGNEKGIGAALGFRLFGVNSYHCVYAPVEGSKNVKDFLMNSEETLGSKMIVNTDPVELAKIIVKDIKAAREKLGWKNN